MINPLLYQTLAFTTHGEILKSRTKNNKFKISSPTWNEGFELPDGSYSASHIQDYLKYILKYVLYHESVTDNSSIMIYVNKIDNVITSVLLNYE